MENYITTKCKDCVFSKDGCKLNKTIFGDNDNQFTDGYCRFKRLNNWNEKYKGFRLDDKISFAIEEETKLSVLISCLDYNIEKLEATIDSVVKNGNKFIKEFIVLTFNNNPNQLHKIASLCKDKNRLGVSWRLENLNHDESIDSFFSMDYGVEFITKSKWFLHLVAGEDISIKSVELIRGMLSFKSNNIVCFYFDKENHSKIIANKNAFIELRGNIEFPWMYKLKTFDNFDLVCMKVD